MEGFFLDLFGRVEWRRTLNYLTSKLERVKGCLRMLKMESFICWMVGCPSLNLIFSFLLDLVSNA